MEKIRSVNKNGGRAGLLDEVRGFAIICMVIYHTMFNLKYMYNIGIPVFFDGWFDVIRDVFAGMFIFISGIMCRYSHNNLKRGVRCFFLGMIITFSVPFFTEWRIYFGVLHLLGISMMIYGLLSNAFEAVPAAIGLAVSAALAVLTWNVANGHIDVTTGLPRGYIGIGGLFEWHLPAKAYNEVMFPLGLPDRSFVSWDYFPLMPWFFVFMAGGYFGYWAKNGAMPGFFYQTHIKWLAFAGRHTIWIYMLHIPVLYAILALVFR